MCLRVFEKLVSEAESLNPFLVLCAAQVWCETCGTTDDDGERMVACDVCGIWKHTRCCGIPDDDNEPETFKCSGCIAKGAGGHSLRRRPDKQQRLMQMLAAGEETEDEDCWAGGRKSAGGRKRPYDY
jgi:hypothetical protein